MKKVILFLGIAATILLFNYDFNKLKAEPQKGAWVKAIGGEKEVSGQYVFSCPMQDGTQACAWWCGWCSATN